MDEIWGHLISFFIESNIFIWFLGVLGAYLLNKIIFDKIKDFLKRKKRKGIDEFDFREKKDIEKDFFVNREGEQEELVKSPNCAFFIQGLPSSGKTALVKKDISTLATKEQAFFEYTFIKGQPASIANSNFWKQLSGFLHRNYNDSRLREYFDNELHGYHLTPKLINYIENAFKKYNPIVVVDDIHHCQEDNGELKQFLELIVTNKLCRIYFVGQSNALCHSLISKGSLEVISVGAMEVKYLEAILRHCTGSDCPDIAEMIYEKLGGLPGYAVTYRNDFPEGVLQTKETLLEKMLDLLDDDKERTVLFALSIASIPLTKQPFDKLGLATGLKRLRQRNLIEKKAETYTVFSNYKDFFADYELDVSTRRIVIEILANAAEQWPELFIDIIKLYIKYEDYAEAAHLFDDIFFVLLHHDLMNHLLGIIQAFEDKGKRSTGLHIKKAILHERLGDYETCQVILESIEDSVEGGSIEFEEIFYIKLRCMYFHDQYDDILKLCNERRAYITGFSVSNQVQIFFIVGRVYYIQGNSKEALRFYLLCFQISASVEEDDLVPLQVKAIHRLSMVEYRLGYKQETLSAFETILKHDKEITGKRKSFILYRIAKCYLAFGEYERARQYCEESNEIKESFGDSRGLAFGNKLLARIFLEMEDVSSALTHIDDAIKFARKTEIIKEEIATSIVKAEILIRQGHKAEAHTLLTFCLGQATSKKLLPKIEEIIEITEGHKYFLGMCMKAKRALTQINFAPKPPEDLELLELCQNLLSEKSRGFFQCTIIEGRSILKKILFEAHLIGTDDFR